MTRLFLQLGSCMLIAVCAVFALDGIGMSSGPKLSDHELARIRGAFSGPIVPDDCPDFFLSEEDTKECQSPFPTVDNTCQAEACVKVDESCVKEMRFWKNEFIHQYYQLGGTRDDLHLKLDPVVCYYETECITGPVDMEKNCTNPGSTIFDVVLGFGLTEGVPCEFPPDDNSEADGCRKCLPRLTFLITDTQHLANKPSTVPCLDINDPLPVEEEFEF